MDLVLLSTVLLSESLPSYRGMDRLRCCPNAVVVVVVVGSMLGEGVCLVPGVNMKLGCSRRRGDVPVDVFRVVVDDGMAV